MSRMISLLLILALAAFAFVGCSDDKTDPVVQVPELAFVGSDACVGCHATQHANWSESGHPYKLTKINGVSPDAAFPAISRFPADPVVPPAGYTWADISYTIGGYGWKMRWMDSNGYIITGINNNQYNFETQTWSDYHFTDPNGTKKYNCGKCHTTGWELSDDGDATNNQDGLEGLVGTFFAGGIHCEECHGMGSQHAVAPRDYDMVLDSNSSLCGRCHTRNADNSIAAKSGFIQHHEQYDEWLHSPHNAVGAPGCNGCHDPHSGVKFDATAAGIGTTASCTDCHTGYSGAGLKHNGLPTCVVCHMPKASKTAISQNAYVADIRTHIWGINTAAVGKTAGMFDAAGTLVLEDGAGMAKVTLDFACYSCHKDEAGVGGSASMRTLQQLSDFVTGADGNGPIHPGAKRVAANR